MAAITRLGVYAYSQGRGNFAGKTATVATGVDNSPMLLNTVGKMMMSMLPFLIVPLLLL